MANECPDQECHDRLTEASMKADQIHEYLFSKGGLKDRVSDFITRKNLWAFLTAILSIVIMAFIVINGMWADTRDLPKLKAGIEKRIELLAHNDKRLSIEEIKSSSFEKRITALEVAQGIILQNTTDIKSMLEKEGD